MSAEVSSSAPLLEHAGVCTDVHVDTIVTASYGLFSEHGWDAALVNRISKSLAQVWLSFLLYTVSSFDLQCLAHLHLNEGLVLETCLQTTQTGWHMAFVAMLCTLVVVGLLYHASVLRSYWRCSEALGPRLTAALVTSVGWEEYVELLCSEMTIRQGRTWSAAHVRLVVTRFEDYIQHLHCTRPDLLPPTLSLWQARSEMAIPPPQISTSSRLSHFLLTQLAFPLLLNRRFRADATTSTASWVLRAMGLLYIVALPAILACHIGILATSFARRRYGAAGVEPGPSRFAYSRCIAASTAARLRHYGDLPHELRGRCRRYIEALGVVLEHAPRHGWMAATRLAHTMAATVLAVFFVASIVLNDETALASFGGVRLYVWISAAALILNMPLGDPPPRSMEARSTTAEAVSYTHLTLPTICSV